MPFYYYLLKCHDGTFYSGSTNDLKKRFAQHNSGKGAKYTKFRRPVEIVYFEELPTYSEVRKREAEVKRLPRAEKAELPKRLSKKSKTLIRLINKEKV